MEISEKDLANYPYSRRLTAMSLLWLMVIFLVGFCIAQFLAVIFILPFVDFDLGKVEELFSLAMNHPQGRLLFLGAQAILSLITFTLTPWIFLKFFDKTFLPFVHPRPFTAPLALLLTFMIVIAWMPASMSVVQWNQQVDLPDFMAGLERWLVAKEDTAKAITLFLINFENPLEFGLGFVAIAILPAIGEELLFRAILQNKLRILLGNVHLAIWVAAFIFSAFHLQFYGLVPRMLLGALFGYLYFWSGNMIVPLFGHLINNGFTLIVFYLHKQGLVAMDIENPDPVPFQAVLLSLALVAALIFVFWKVVRKDNTIN